MRSTSSSSTDLEEAAKTFQDYVGIKLHFNDPLVWTRSTRLRLNVEQLLKRRDAYVFLKMNEQEADREARVQRLFSLFKMNKGAWSGAIFEEEATAYHKKRMATISALKHVVRTDIDRIVLFMEERQIDVRKLLLSDGQRPYIVSHEHAILGGVTDETLALINKGFKFCSQTSIDPLWEERAFMLDKYSYCLEADSEFLKQQFNKLVAVSRP